MTEITKRKQYNPNKMFECMTKKKTNNKIVT